MPRSLGAAPRRGKVYYTKTIPLERLGALDPAGQSELTVYVESIETPFLLPKETAAKY